MCVEGGTHTPHTQKDTMKRVRLILEGKVQQARYRDYVLKTAREHKITGYVENMRDGSVEIVSEGDSEKVDKFAEVIKSGKGRKITDCPLASVESIVYEEGTPTGKYSSFEIKYGITQEELRDQLGAAQEILLGFWNSTTGKIDMMENKYDKISAELGEIKKILKDMPKDFADELRSALK